MKFFIDTANVDEIRKANDMGVIAGVTTNPSLIAKEHKDYAKTLAEIATIVDGPISGEVKATTTDAETMIKEGEAIYALDPKHMVVKIPMTVEGLKAIKALSAKGIDFDTLLSDLESRLEAMDIGPLLGLWFQTLVVGLTMNILSICIFLVTYGRMIEIYAVTALGPIPLATLGNAEWRGMGQNYLKSLLALGFQAFLIMVVVGIYAVLIQQIGTADDI